MRFRITLIASLTTVLIVSSCMQVAKKANSGRYAFAGFDCDASGAVDKSTSTSTYDSLEGFTVNLLNAPDPGPFKITIPTINITSGTSAPISIITDGSSTSYTFSQEESFALSNGTILGQVQVVDCSSDDANCDNIAGADPQIGCSINSGISGGLIGLTPYPRSTQGLNGTIIVVPSVYGITDPVYSRPTGSLSLCSGSGTSATATVTQPNTGNTSGVYFVSDSVAECVSFTLDVSSNSNSSVTASSSIQLTFSSQVQNPVSAIASPNGSSATVGNKIYLFAATSGINIPYYYWSITSGSGTLDNNNQMQTAISSTTAGAVTVQLNVNGYTSSITVNFTNASSSSGLTCKVSLVPGVFYPVAYFNGRYYGSGIIMAVIGTDSSTNANVAVQVESWNPGEAWNANGGQPTFPLVPPLEIYYESPGQKNGTITAEDASGRTCTATYGVYIQPW